MNPVIIICSRRESSRLPAKAFREIAGRPAIQHILARVCGKGVPVVVAVPPSEDSDYAGHVAGYNGAEVFVGRGDSPLHRMAEYLLANPGHDWVVRITHDDILIDWDTVDGMLKVAGLGNISPAIGYLRTPEILEGAGVEVIHADNILAAAALMEEGTEFVSYYVRGPGAPRPQSGDLMTPARLRRPAYRLTMDYPEDATLLEIVLRRLGPDATATEVCAYLDSHRDLLRINRLPFLSIYTCVKDGGHGLVEAMRDVLNSGVNDLEYVVVDDGSTDGTVETIASFLPDPRIKLIVNPKNVGLAASSNIAVKNCRSRWVMRVDADDKLAPDFYRGLLQLMARAEAEKLDVVYPAYATIDTSNTVTRAWNDPTTHEHMGGALVRKRMLDEIRFRDGLRHWDGLELAERLRAREGRVGYAPDILTWQYRVRPDSMSRSEPEKRAALRANIMEGRK